MAPRLVTARPRGRYRSPHRLAAVAVTGAMALMPFANPVVAREKRPKQPSPASAWGLDLASELAAAARPGAGASVAMASRQPPAERGAGDAATGSAGETGQATREARSGPARPTPVAAVSGIRLVVPSMATALVGFHEAAMPGSLPMASVAPLEENLNPKPIPTIEKTQPDQVAPVMVLPGRNRPQQASSAVDIAVPEGEEISAPVSGTVTAVAPYTLYGRHPDHRIEIQPEGRPDLRVIVIHIADVRVEVGDELVAGETPLAGTALVLPFESQIDRFAQARVGRALPHIHVEVQGV